MMQLLGSPDLMAAYHQRLVSSHDYDLLVDTLTMNETPLGPARLVDGQINIQPDADIRRTGSLTLLDPDRSLGLDAGSEFGGALFADRMVRVRHAVDVPDFGPVIATVFVGPISKLNRNGATIDLEVQDKTALAILGCPPMTVTKGTNAVEAIVAIMTQRTGEAHFRVPAGTRYRLVRNYSVGWSDEASPWAVCSLIAAAAGLTMLYSCDGYLTLRPKQTSPVFEFGAPNLTSTVAGDNDFSSVVNYARATYGNFVKTAVAPSDHPLTPVALGRNGVPRYLPSLAEVDAPDRPDRPGSKHRKASKAQRKKYAAEMEKYDTQLKTSAQQAQAQANALVTAGLPMNDNLSWSSVPVFHLDVDDVVTLTTDTGTTTLALSSGSIPLLPAEMSGGAVKVIAKPGRIRR